MKAIVQGEYGPPRDVLELEEVDQPVVKDDDVLVRVHAASVHIGDWILVRGVPYIMRMGTGLRGPKVRVPGTDIAGTVEAIGKDVTQLQLGDEVFGWCKGAFAEYATAGAGDFALKRQSTSRSSKPRLLGRQHSPPFRRFAIKGRSSPDRRS